MKAVVILSRPVDALLFKVLPKVSIFILEPDTDKLSKRVQAEQPFELLLVVGKEACRSYKMTDAHNPTHWARVVELEQPEATWSRADIAYARKMIVDGTQDYEMKMIDGQMSIQTLVPF